MPRQHRPARRILPPALLLALAVGLQGLGIGTAAAAGATVTDDEATTTWRTPVTLPGTLNDTSTNLPFRTQDARFFPLSEGEIAAGNDESADGRVLYRLGVGTWSMNGNGSVLFAPEGGFAGRTGADMYVYDAKGVRSHEALLVTVQFGPGASVDRIATFENVSTTFSVLDNDVPGTNADGTSGTFDLTSVRFTDDNEDHLWQVSTDRKTLTVPTKGVLTISTTTGAVTWKPDRGYHGAIGPFAYGARDTVTTSDGATVHNAVRSSFTVVVTQPVPVAWNNWSNTTVGVPVEVPVLANDRAGDPSAPLDPTTVRLRLSAGGLPTGSTSSDHDRTITIPGRGTYHVRDDGIVVATPSPGFSGVIPTIRYDVRDTNGTLAKATVTVGVAKPTS